jgi:DNA-directed RNA polymerase specialized sigma24 family protein
MVVAVAAPGRARVGIDTSFEDWYLREHPRLLATMTVAAGDVDLARDVTHEAFMRVLERTACR